MKTFCFLLAVWSSAPAWCATPAPHPHRPQPAPTAPAGLLTTNDAVCRAAHAAVTVAILANDPGRNNFDAATVDLDPTTAGRQTTALGMGGTFAVTNAGLVTFTPSEPYTGGLVSTVTYTVRTAAGTLSNVSALRVVATNAPPTPADDAAATAANTPVACDVTGNDTDPDGAIDPATLDLDPARAGRQTSRTVPGEGHFAVTDAGRVVFTPAPGFAGVAVLPYLVQDDNGTPAAAPATLRIWVGTRPTAVK